MLFINLEFFFYLFSFLCVISSIFVIVSKNPLHSIIYLILVFCNIVFLLLLHKIEFLSMVFLIVYIGAIAVLFLFVVYMLNIKVIELNESNFTYLIGIFFFFILFFFYFIINFLNINFFFNSNFFELDYNFDFLNKFYNINNLNLISRVVYNDYFFIFFIIGLILLIAMVGAIILTSQRITVNKEQIIHQQNMRFIKTK